MLKRQALILFCNTRQAQWKHFTDHCEIMQKSLVVDLLLPAREKNLDLVIIFVSFLCSFFPFCWCCPLCGILFSWTSSFAYFHAWTYRRSRPMLCSRCLVCFLVLSNIYFNEALLVFILSQSHSVQMKKLFQIYVTEMQISFAEISWRYHLSYIKNNHRYCKWQV